MCLKRTSDIITAKLTRGSAAQLVEVTWHNRRSVALICVCAHLSVQACLAWYSGHHTQDSVPQQVQIRLLKAWKSRWFFFLPIIYCQWWRCRGTYASRYSSFLGSPKNALRDGPTLKTHLPIPRESCLYMWNKLCLVLCVFPGYIPVPPSVQPALARKPFPSETCIFILKAIFYFFHKPTISDQKWMKPVIFDECLFKLIPHGIIVSFALSLPFSSLFYSWMIFFTSCQTQDYINFLGRNFNFTQLCREHCIFIYIKLHSNKNLWH